MSIAKVLFRVDAGPSIGLGHLQRSLSLATALQTSDVESLFLGPDDSGTVERIGQFGYAFKPLPKSQPWSLDDARGTQDVADNEECSTIIVDSHQVGAEYLSHLRDAGLFVALRDDLAGFPFPCQLVINGNADAKKLGYFSSSGDTVFLLGTDYMVLGQEYWDWPSLTNDRPVENVLVTVGGTDDFNLMPQIIETLDRLPGCFSLTAIVGPFFENVGAVEQAASRMSRKIKLYHNPPNLHDAIVEADLAVSAAGQTLYELACAGCPTVAFSVASNQQSQMENLAEAGFLRMAGCATNDDVIGGVGETVRSLLKGADARSVMASAGRRLVDGQGALRVVQQLLTTTGNPV